MASFAIVPEGITDQRVIDNIITGYFGDDAEEPSVNYVQPLLDTTGEKAEPEPGGWGMVLKFLELGKHREALQFNDYLVLHLDTDVSEDFGVPHRQGGKELSVTELVEQVIDKLEATIGPNSAQSTRTDSSSPSRYTASSAGSCRCSTRTAMPARSPAA